MDITGSIFRSTLPLSADLGDSIGGGIGSAAIDTVVDAAFLLPNLLLGFIGGLGGDLGSTGSAGIGEALLPNFPL